jgi:rhodanese-related sulfurtransferase
MKRNAMRKFLLLAFVVIGCSTGKKEDSTQQVADYASLNPSAFNEALSQDVMLLDVRTPEEYSSGFIAGAVNLDYRASDFSAKLDSMDQSKKYMVYCAAGGRSSKASDLMKEKGFVSVSTLDGGTQAWVASGLPLTTP